MEYNSFEEGLRALASHQTGDKAFFGLLQVGLTPEAGKPQPYIQLENHHLTLNADEAAHLRHIVLDCERFDTHGTKISMRLELRHEETGWVIKQWLPVKHSKLHDPKYDQYEILYPAKESDAQELSQKTTQSLGFWRISNREILRDNNSVGTLLDTERQYCGAGISNAAYLHQSAIKR